MFPSWLVIAVVGFVVASAASVTRPEDRRWFNRLQRPSWLTFERLIPIIWTVIFICGGWSAYIVWEAKPRDSYTWMLMALYLLLEILTITYTPATFWTRSLKVGTIIGGIGAILGFTIALLVWSVARWATFLLLPYILWSPIGTYTTWVMDKLNSGSEYD